MHRLREKKHISGLCATTFGRFPNIVTLLKPTFSHPHKVASLFRTYVSIGIMSVSAKQGKRETATPLMATAITTTIISLVASEYCYYCHVELTRGRSWLRLFPVVRPRVVPKVDRVIYVYKRMHSLTGGGRRREKVLQYGADSLANTRGKVVEHQVRRCL